MPGLLKYDIFLCIFVKSSQKNKMSYAVGKIYYYYSGISNFKIQNFFVKKILTLQPTAGPDWPDEVEAQQNSAMQPALL